MTIIADSGSTKTEWCATDGRGTTLTVNTQGINPYFQDDTQVEEILRGELLPTLRDRVGETPMLVCFYGAGMREEMKPRMATLLQRVLEADTVQIHNDLIGAARALFMHGEGIACILGTGSNSGCYDGKGITANTPPMGFILGDEGSGATLGKEFLGALCKGLMPKGMMEHYEETTGQGVADIIEHVYRQPMPNRYLAQATHYIRSRIGVPEVENLVVENFRRFFRRNVAIYARPDLRVGAVGSVAHYFRKQLETAAKQEGYNLCITLQKPLQRLVEYHTLTL